MKGWIGVFALIVLLMLGIAPSVMASAVVIKMDVGVSKNVTTSGESYGIEFSLSGGGLANVKEAVLSIPNGLKMYLSNKLAFTSIDLSAGSMSETTLAQRFPAGLYTATLYPNQYGVLQTNVSFDFPSTPEFTYPLNGATGVSLTPTITWGSLSGITDLKLKVLTTGNVAALTVSLPTNATSFEISGGVLEANTQYEAQLIATDQNGTGNCTSSIKTISTISFTTGAQ